MVRNLSGCQAMTRKAAGLYYRRGESMRLRNVIWCTGFLTCGAASAKEPPAQVMAWPASGPAVVRFTFGKFKETGSYGKRHSYTSDFTAENVWNKKISAAQFTVYAFDKAKIPIADGTINASSAPPVTTAKFHPFLNPSPTSPPLSLPPQTP